MEEEDFVGCISCMSTKDLCDLFAVYSDNVETYAQMLETCFDLKVSNDLKYICAVCVEKLETAATYKEQTAKSIAILQSIRDEEYLDESIFEDAESDSRKENKLQKVVIVRKGSDAANDNNDYDDEVDDEHAIQALDETCCIYCDLQLNTAEEVSEHIKTVHGLEPRTGLRLRECSLCGVALRDSASDHMVRCHGMKSEREGRQFPCHFCDNVYTSRKACFTHLRMKHGLKMCSDQTPKYVPRERKKCHMCNRDFSQKQILNKHLWKAHGFEVEKRKAFTCPLCSERVSYGGHFSEHLARCHQVREVIERLEFHNMDDFMLYKSAIQEETKYRFRKTTASKQTIEGVRSHYMCSQSGVYVYQGKGKRPAPERQIYKTGKACPAHMIVTETMDRVTVTFHKTHVGHGACPYYEPRDKKPKLTAVAPAPRPAPAPVPAPDDVKSEESELKVEDGATLAVAVEVGEGAPGAPAWMCDACGAALPGADEMRAHMAAHGLPLYACRYCDNVYQSAEAWSRHETCDHGAVY